MDRISTTRSNLSSRSDDPKGRLIRALKGRLGHYARPEGRDEPFRARVFAEPAPSLRSGQAFSARTQLNLASSISPRDLTCRAVGYPCPEGPARLLRAS